jgi:hypothetical protein
LEILDPQRFCRGVPIADAKLLDAVMVRRLKSDLREISDDFPDRRTIPIAIAGLPEDTPELRLAQLLAQYRHAREERMKGATRTQIACAMLVVTSLQKRLLSSIEAFACTLQVHRRGVDQAIAQAGRAASSPPHIQAALPLLLEAPGADDDRAELAETEVQAEEEAEMEQATTSAAAPGPAEIQLLAEMTRLAGRHRYDPDVKVQRLVQWLRQNLCPDLGTPGARWNDRRVLIFTEYADTKRYHAGSRQHQAHSERDDRQDVAAKLAQRRGQRLPIEQGGQEHQKDQVGLDAHAGHAGHQGQEQAAEHQQHGIGDSRAPR